MERLVWVKGIFNPVRERMEEDTGLLLSQGRIAEKGRFPELRARWPQVPVWDFREEYALPGLVNTHVHLEFQPGPDTYKVYLETAAEERLRQALRAANRLLLSGVTTVRDAGSSMDLVKALKAEKAGLPLPRLILAGPPLTVRGGHLAFLGGGEDSLEELREGVFWRKERGCDFIKIVASGGQLTPGSKPEEDYYGVREIRAVTEAAKGQGLLTAAHCLTVNSAAAALEGGVDSVEHLACFRRNRENGMLERVYEPERLARFQDIRRFYMPGLSNNYHALDRARQDPEAAGERERFLLKQEREAWEIVKRARALGLRVVTGTDGGCGETDFGETWLEVCLLAQNCGFSNGEALRAVAWEGACAVGLESEAGRLERGYQADLITLRSDPLKDIKALAHVEHVIFQGKQIK